MVVPVLLYGRENWADKRRTEMVKMKFGSFHAKSKNGVNNVTTNIIYDFYFTGR
jgi:hypothetical protein